MSSLTELRAMRDVATAAGLEAVIVSNWLSVKIDNTWLMFHDIIMLRAAVLHFTYVEG